MNKEELLNKLLICNRCGLCQEVCPTYRVSGHEFAVARGRLRLIRMALEGELDLEEDKEIETFINECLLCKACETVCPSFVPITEIISEIRKNYIWNNGLPLAKRIMYHGVFSRNKNLDFLRKLLLIYQGTGTNKIIEKVQILKKSPFNLLPELTKKTVREQLADVSLDLVKPDRRIAYFLGCSVNTFFSEIGIATIKVLQQNNCQIVVPEVNCCGAPHQSAGDQKESIHLARRNLNILKAAQVEEIIVDCATCGAVLKEYPKLFKDDPEYCDLAQEVAEKIIDVSAFLLKIDYRRPVLGLPEVLVTYHDPCHALRSLKIKSEPRQILLSIPGVKLIEMQDADSCCGGAGAYSVFQAKTSQNILQEKIHHFQQTKATLLATSCPACTMQLSFGLKLANLQGKLVHPVELLARAYARESNE